jgi:hypothetical protein
VFKDLHGHPVLKWDGGHFGSVLSPHMVGFMKPGKLRKKKRASSCCCASPSWAASCCGKGEGESIKKKKSLRFRGLRFNAFYYETITLSLVIFNVVY